MDDIAKHEESDFFVQADFYRISQEEGEK